LIGIEQDLKELLRRSASASESGNEIVEGAPKTPLSTLLEFGTFEKWIQQSDNLHKIVISSILLSDVMPLGIIRNSCVMFLQIRNWSTIGG
jgi:hypothetical protein